MGSSSHAMLDGIDGRPWDVLVIGGGQAGLVMGHHLSTRGMRFLIVDAAEAVGEAWRRRWDSLKLFTAAQYDDLPGMRFPAPRDTYPGKDDVADFLQAYAKRFELPVMSGTEVSSLGHRDLFEARTNRGPVRAHNVVIATGPFQIPFVPPMAEDLDDGVFQLHSADYRRPGSIPSGRVLVVGAANTGCQIALELSATHEVEVSAGRHLPTVPQRPFGRDVWWWGTRLGITRITVGSRLGRRLSTRDQVIGGGERELRRKGVAIRPRLAGVEGRSLRFADGSTAEYSSVLWATGFRTDHSWVDIPNVLDERGRVRHERGVTRQPGLYVLGLTWQHTRTSALLGWVTKDAEYLTGHLVSRRAVAAPVAPAGV